MRTIAPGHAAPIAGSATIAANGQGDAAQLAQVLRTERGGLWILMALSIVNIVLAVWRPRLYRH